MSTQYQFVKGDIVLLVKSISFTSDTKEVTEEVVVIVQVMDSIKVIHDTGYTHWVSAPGRLAKKIGSLSIEEMLTHPSSAIRDMASKL